ncbi:hypothetical protein Zmor_004170 [Zophobas morio]|uniref:Retrovirus-related Pol polyprotein from type-2 retrotransposable element R2DM n=1 Tax=Zophobas morio TaxID=2755281 RepID=A0AA38HMC3_9CUCU|nr:hypothetical protein Zmor_004170 [Zophobas morio]
MSDKNRDVRDAGGDNLKCPYCDATYKSRGGLHKHKTKFHPSCLPPPASSSRVLINPPRVVAGSSGVSNTAGASSQEDFNSGAQSLSTNSNGCSEGIHSGNPGTSDASYYPHLCDCGSRFHDRDSLRRHHKICPVWTSTSCRFCERSFESFKGRKAHEQKSHKAEWNEGMEAKLLVYQDRKVSKTIPPLKEVTTTARTAPRRAAAVAALEALGCDLPSKEVQTTQVGEIPVSTSSEMVSRGKSKDTEAHINITREVSQFVAPPRSHSPGEHSSQAPGCSFWPLPPAVPRMVPSDFEENDIATSATPNDTTNYDLPSQLRLSISASLDSLGNDHSHLVNIVSNALAGSDFDFQAALDRYVASLSPDSSSNSQKRPAPPKALPVYRNRAQAKAAAYKKAQDLFQKAPKSLVEQILSGKLESQEPCDVLPSIEDVESLYGNLLESTPEHMPDTRLDNSPDYDVSPVSVSPVRPDEVTFAKQYWPNSAPGLDRISVATTKKIPDLHLAVLFNAILLRNVLPTSWRTTNTVLIPKKGDLKDPANWRPITLISVLQRLFHRILAKKISACVELHGSQRGFRRIDGTLANLLTLESFIHGRRTAKRDYHLLSLDVRKAFDSVSQRSVVDALRAKGVNGTLLNYIQDTLMGSQTVFKVGRNSTRPIKIKRGVRQGDPLSPLLFNIVLDPLIRQINNNFKGGEVAEGVSLSVMAFADDLVAFGDTHAEAQEILCSIASSLSSKGMEININKCAAVSVEYVHGSPAVLTKPQFFLDGRPIPQVSDINTFQYLGHDISAAGSQKPSIHNLKRWLELIGRAPLKPFQKFFLLKRFIVTKLYHCFQNPRVSKNDLKDADKLIKLFVKRWLHLHLHTQDASLYARVRDGGLGLTELSSSLPFILIGRLTNLASRARELDDIHLQAIMASPYVLMVRTKLEAVIGPEAPSNLWRQNLIQCPFTTGLEVASEDASSRSWLEYPPKGWSARDWVGAVHLRTANLPTQGIPSNPVHLRGCRDGCDAQETICHVLQRCPVTHWQRIDRHNAVVRKVRDHCVKKTWPVEEEPQIRHPDGTLYKPDLAIHLPASRTVICDVQISWETSRPMGQVWDSKRVVYDNPKFREAARRYWPTKTLIFLPLILGARGTWPRANSPTAQELHFTSTFKRSCVVGVIKGGVMIHSAFNRAVWSRRKRKRIVY